MNSLKWKKNSLFIDTIITTDTRNRDIHRYSVNSLRTGHRTISCQKKQTPTCTVICIQQFQDFPILCKTNVS